MTGAFGRQQRVCVCVCVYVCVCITSKCTYTLHTHTHTQQIDGTGVPMRKVPVRENGAEVAGAQVGQRVGIRVLLVGIRV